MRACKPGCLQRAGRSAMRHFLFKTLFVSLVALGGLMPIWPNEAFCLGCLWRGTCYNHSICGSGCICVKRNTIDVSGFCAVRY